MAQLSPENILRRITRLSAINGWSITVVAGLGGLISLAFADWIGAITGIVVALGGATELRGRRRILARDASGVRLLVLAQGIVLGMLWVYAITQLVRFDAAALLAGLPPEVQTMFDEAGYDRASVQQLLFIANLALYAAVMLASLIYQGGLALYYRHRAPTVAEALGLPPVTRP